MNKKPGVLEGIHRGDRITVTWGHPDDEKTGVETVVRVTATTVATLPWGPHGSTRSYSRATGKARGAIFTRTWAAPTTPEDLAKFADQERRARLLVVLREALTVSDGVRAYGPSLTTAELEALHAALPERFRQKTFTPDAGQEKKP